MLKGIKLRLYLTGEQEEKINSMLGSYRFVFNQCLSYRKERYESEGLNTSRSELSHYFHQELRNVHEWLKCHNTKVMKQSILNLEDAYNSFFKQGKGFPRFKSRRDEQKMRFPKEAVSSKTFDETSSRLNLTKDIKGLKFECSDRDRKYLYKNKEGIRSVTIKRTKTGKYFATVLIDGELLRQMDRPTNHTVGIDLGIKTLLTLSTGESIENPKWIRNNEKRLKRLQKQMSKKVKGSNNREKARLRLAVLHEKIKNQKQDYLHNITSKIINENQVIIIEDLNISGMMKNHNLAKSIQELGLHELQRQLEYKSKWYGRTLVFVDRWFPSSKTCSGCGWVNKNLTLKDREFTCHSCGLIIDRDLNASINIEIEGIRTLNENNIGQRLPEFTLVDSPLMDDKEVIPLKSHDWLNQENDNLYNFVQV